jgi:hypothetical protein
LLGFVDYDSFLEDDSEILEEEFIENTDAAEIQHPIQRPATRNRFLTAINEVRMHINKHFQTSDCVKEFIVSSFFEAMKIFKPGPNEIRIIPHPDCVLKLDASLSWLTIRSGTLSPIMIKSGMTTNFQRLGRWRGVCEHKDCFNDGGKGANPCTVHGNQINRLVLVKLSPSKTVEVNELLYPGMDQTRPSRIYILKLEFVRSRNVAHLGSVLINANRRSEKDTMRYKVFSKIDDADLELVDVRYSDQTVQLAQIRGICLSYSVI